jgi:hypothetical protein
MPKYYFDLRDGDTVVDSDGTELPNVGAARAHANNVARELMFRSKGLLNDRWSNWSMAVHDAEGEELFSFRFTDVKSDEEEDQIGTR